MVIIGLMRVIIIQIFKWYDGCKKRKAQKAKIKEEFLPLSQQPLKLWDWCVSEDGQGDAEKL